MHPKFLFIKIEDKQADKIIKGLVDIRKKAGLSEDDLPIAFDSARGGIRIPVENINAYDMKNGNGSLLKKLESEKENFSRVIKDIELNVDGAVKLPRSNQDQEVVFQKAREIFGNAMKGKITGGENTTSPEGKKTYLGVVNKSPNTLGC